jgi:FKBP-type peptidyl-prolyl cis-trans isomerase FklB
MPVAIDRGGLISSRLYSFALLAHEQGNRMKQHRLAAAIALVGLVLAGCDKQASTVELKTPAQKASYGIGLNMGKSLAQEGMDDLDSKAVALGIEDAVGKKEQKLKDEELVAAFGDLQKRAEERMAKMSEESAAAGKKFLEENGKRKEVTTTASGLQYEIVKKADGPVPKPTDVVTVHYEGKLTDGKVFDSSVERGSPIDLPVSGVIPGWVEGLQLMHVGEKIKLYIPSDLAYGAQSPSPMIPANSVLVFDLELLGIKDPAAAGNDAAGGAAGADEEEEAAPAPEPAKPAAKK